MESSSRGGEGCVREKSILFYSARMATVCVLYKFLTKQVVVDGTLQQYCNEETMNDRFNCVNCSTLHTALTVSYWLGSTNSKRN